ncbi:uncharacterized protein N7487_000100 [Penicillium crustosum]|uniref:uncharacterized protein n=1 Tax=Penicillium crustosum TaxID=36656 RepID=UPI00238EB47A|nr:uncharacterized protein N7487_000100 [Penicillium crustosum]KAJ5416550.1 hypothetical protein N7487_000100 [Penicillium crustosum]
MDRIGDLLRTPQVAWNRQSANSREFRKAVVAISYVLGGSRASAEPQTSEDALPSTVPTTAVSYFPDFTSKYDVPGMDLGSTSTMERMVWPIVTATLNDEAEQSLGGNGSQQMDMTL